MKLSNALLLSAVWSIAITGLLLLSASMASADIMKLEWQDERDGPPGFETFMWGPGRLGVIYDASFQLPSRGEMIYPWGSNTGLLSDNLLLDQSFVDPFTEEFHLVWRAWSQNYPLGTGIIEQDVARLHRDGQPYDGTFTIFRTLLEDGSYDQQFDWTRDDGMGPLADGYLVNSLTFEVPEASAMTLVLLAALCCLAIGIPRG